MSALTQHTGLSGPDEALAEEVAEIAACAQAAFCRKRYDIKGLVQSHYGPLFDRAKSDEGNRLLVMLLFQFLYKCQYWRPLEPVGWHRQGSPPPVWSDFMKELPAKYEHCSVLAQDHITMLAEEQRRTQSLSLHQRRLASAVAGIIAAAQIGMPDYVLSSVHADVCATHINTCLEVLGKLKSVYPQFVRGMPDQDRLLFVRGIPDQDRLLLQRTKEFLDDCKTGKSRRRSPGFLAWETFTSTPSHHLPREYEHCPLLKRDHIYHLMMTL